MSTKRNLALQDQKWGTNSLLSKTVYEIMQIEVGVRSLRPIEIV